MKKSEIKNILFSMRTTENEESIRNYLQEKINSIQGQHENHTKINKMFSYGISGNTIHYSRNIF